MDLVYREIKFKEQTGVCFLIPEPTAQMFSDTRESSEPWLRAQASGHHQTQLDSRPHQATLWAGGISSPPPRKPPLPVAFWRSSAGISAECWVRCFSPGSHALLAGDSWQARLKEHPRPASQVSCFKPSFYLSLSSCYPNAEDFCASKSLCV